jgi:hypothetical protein
MTDERFKQSMAFVVAVYCYAHAIRTYLPQEPLTYFSEDDPYLENFTFGKHTEKGLPLKVNFGCMGTRPIINFTTAVASPERRMRMNEGISATQNTSFNHARQPDKSIKPCFASLSVMHTDV